MSTESFLHLVQNSGYADDRRLPSTGDSFLPALSTTSLLSEADSDASVFSSLDFCGLSQQVADDIPKSSLDTLPLHHLAIGETQNPVDSSLGSGNSFNYNQQGDSFFACSTSSGCLSNTPALSILGNSSPLFASSTNTLSSIWSDSPPSEVAHFPQVQDDTPSSVPVDSNAGLFRGGAADPASSAKPVTLTTGSGLSPHDIDFLDFGSSLRAPSPARMCKVCGQEILPGVMSQNFNGIAIHQQCCICANCNRRAAAGEPVNMVNGRLQCKLCSSRLQTAQASPTTMQDFGLTSPLLAEGHESHPATRQMTGLLPAENQATGSSIRTEDTMYGSGASSPVSESDNSSATDLVFTDCAEDKGDGTNAKTSEQSKPSRGPRTQIKPNQLTILTALFSRNPKPSRQAQEQAAKETGLSKRVVQVWFQNKRSKEKRIRQMQMPQFSDFTYLNGGNYFAPHTEYTPQPYSQQAASFPPTACMPHTSSMRVANPMLVDSDQYGQESAICLMHPAAVPPTSRHSNAQPIPHYGQVAGNPTSTAYTSNQFPDDQRISLSGFRGQNM